jgi:hypothetical protein
MQDFQSLKTLYRHIQYSESQNTCKQDGHRILFNKFYF